METTAPNLPLFLAIVGSYFALLVLLGYQGWRKTKTAEDYMLAGRGMHSFVMALSYGASFISTAAIIGFTGLASMLGLGLLWLVFANIAIGILVAFTIFGRSVRKVGSNLNAVTFPELLGKRVQSGFVQGFAGLLIFLTLPLYAGVILIGAARFIAPTLQVSYEGALIAFSIIIAIYVVIGGLKSAMLAEAFQGALMFLGMGALAIMVYAKLGGIVPAHQALTALAPQVPADLAAKGLQGWTAMPAFGSPFWWLLVTSIILPVGLGSLAQPQLNVRFMTVKRGRDLNRGVLIGGLFMLVMVGTAYVTGALSNVFFWNHFLMAEGTGKLALEATAGLSPNGKPNVDLVMPLFLNLELPQWYVYVFMVTLLAAAMSTLSSLFHAMGSALGRDVVQVWMQKSGEAAAGTIKVTRIAITFAILASVLIAFSLPPSIVAMGTAFVFGLFGAAFLPMLVGGLFTRGLTKAGAIAGMLTGCFSSLAWTLLVHGKEAGAVGLADKLFGGPLFPEPWASIDSLLIALPLATLVTILVSLVTPKPDAAHLEKCFAESVYDEPAKEAK